MSQGTTSDFLTRRLLDSGVRLSGGTFVPTQNDRMFVLPAGFAAATHTPYRRSINKSYCNNHEF